MRKFLMVLPMVLAAGSAMAQNGAGTAGILDTRSIFDQYRGAPATGTKPGRTGGVMISDTYAPATVPYFVGAVRQNDVVTGFIEITDATGIHTLQVRDGDSIPWNNTRILEIGLDTLQLTINSQSKIVQVGNNLLNQPRAAMPGASAPAVNPRITGGPARGRTPSPRGASLPGR